MTTSTLYTLCGAPGSGKSTYSIQLAEQAGAERYSFDEYPGACDPRITKQAKQQMYDDVYHALTEGRDVVLDDLHTKKEWRVNLLSILQGAKCRKVLIVMTTPLEECLIRNQQRMRRLPDFVVKKTWQDYEKPDLNEGWDEIVYF